MYALLWLLLPVAAASGWWAASYSQGKRRSRARAQFNSAYGQGINYLLNEEPDKATEVLVRLVEVDPDTVELHLALGSLFRRRGEVGRAIRVHQNIIARSRLSDALRLQATLELARDFHKAGLLDRAEQLFNSLLDRGVDEPIVCQHLVDIYQQEKEWAKAIDVAQRVVGSDPAHWKIRIAHYHCELGDAALAQGDYAQALVQAERAQCVDGACVRALLLKAAAYQHAGDFQAAIDAYESVGSGNRGLIPEIKQALRACYAGLSSDGMPLEAVSGGVVAAPGGRVQSGGETRFRCELCGFSSKKLFWQCPGCRSWSSVKPLD